MKNILIFIIAVISVKPFSLAQQVESVVTDINSTFPYNYEEKTRVMEHTNHTSVVFIDSLGSTYIVVGHDFNYANPAVPCAPFYKKELPTGLVISDMKHITNPFWFCGSENGYGIYGRLTLTSNYYSIYSMHIFSVLAVNNLKKFSIATNMSDSLHQRIFAIGEISNQSTIQPCIVELDVQGQGYTGFEPYIYAKTDILEPIDDIDLVNNIVVVATRDMNAPSPIVTLRFSDIETMLTGVEIDYKWQFVLSSQDHVRGKVHIVNINNKFIEVCYTKFNDSSNRYTLCLHRINLNDLMNGITNSIISQEIDIDIGEEIFDITYDAQREVLILLLDKDNISSVFLHTLPNETLTYGAIRLASPNGDRFFSIDTVQHFYALADRMYEAWGGTKRFMQAYSYNGSIEKSCYLDTELRVSIVYPIKIKKLYEPLERFIGTRTYLSNQNPWEPLPVDRECYKYTTK